MARKSIPLSVKLAAALLMMRDESGERLICHEHAKEMSAEQIMSLFVWDHHPVPYAEGGPDAPWNLTPRLISGHREKTAKIDVPQIAKGKRIRKKEAEHRMVMGLEERCLLERDIQNRPRYRWPSRPFNRTAKPKPRPKPAKVLPRRLIPG
jgi:hypothetical protein